MYIPLSLLSKDYSYQEIVNIIINNQFEGIINDINPINGVKYDLKFSNKDIPLIEYPLEDISEKIWKNLKSLL